VTGSVVLTGRGLVGGVAEGEALVTREAISGWGGVEPRKGRVIESRHELVGQSFAGKVLVFRGAKGSSGWSGMFHMSRLMGSAPAAMVFTTMNTKIALGVVVTRVPAITDLDGDPFELIHTGDWVRVDADRGLLTVTRPGGSVVEASGRLGPARGSMVDSDAAAQGRALAEELGP
jgi:predicted aconitase with swiveling domain